MPITRIKYRGHQITPSSGEDINLDAPVSITYGGVEKGTVNAGTKKTLKTIGKISLFNIFLNELGLKTAGKAFDSDIEIEVDSYQKLSIPTISGSSSITYNKTSQHPTVNYDNTKITATGDLSATVVGNYRITYSINDKLTYTWADGTQEDKYIEWSIIKREVNIPTITGSFVYDKSAHNASISGYDSNWMTQTGTISEINSGDYTVTWDLIDKENSCWTGETVSSKRGTWSIAVRKLAIPSVVGTYTYNGSSQEAQISGFDDNYETKAGALTGTNVGDYRITFSLPDKTNTAWSDNSTTDKYGDWDIDKLSLAIPSVSGSYTYNSSEQTVIKSSFNATYENVTGDKATNVGNYTAVFTLKDTVNTQWNDETITGKTSNWSIAPKEISVPTCSSPVFTGEEIETSVSGLDGTYAYKNTGSGVFSATHHGNYTAVFTLKDTVNTKWVGQSVGVADITTTWSITVRTVNIPSTSGTYTYNGNDQTVTVTNFDSAFSRNTSDTQLVGHDAGTYTAKWELIYGNGDTTWTDGTTGVKTKTWSIGKAEGYVTVSGDIRGTVSVGDSATVSVRTNHGGTLTVTSSNTRYATCSINGTTITCSHGGNTGSWNQTVTFTVTCAATANYTQATTTFTGTFAKTSSCVAGDTLIMMGDGSEKMISELKRGDSIMTYNMDSGKFEPQIIAIFWDESNISVPSCLHLTFDNGKVVKVIANHGFFDKTLNTYVYIDYDNFNDYIGHEFAAYGEDECKFTKLVKAEMVEGIETQYSIESAYNDNFITEGLLSMTQEPCEGRFEYFKFDDNEVKWDAKDKQENIDKYGLYTWEEWKELIPDEEMFYAWNGPYFKILMDKGIVTMDDIYYMLEDASHGL